MRPAAVVLIITAALLTAGPVSAAVIQGRNIADAAAGAVETELKHLAVPCDIEITGMPRDINVPEGTVALKAVTGDSSGRSGSFTIPVQVFVDRRLITTAYPRLRIRLYQEVAVALRTIPAGAVLEKSSVALQKRDISGVHSGFFTDTNALEGKEARVRIFPGTILVPGMLQTKPVIRRGDAVRIEALMKGITVFMNGIAKEDGIPGERIRVLNLSTRRPVKAVVVSSGKVSFYDEREIHE